VRTACRICGLEGASIERPAPQGESNDVAEKVEKLVLRERQLEKQIEDLQRKMMSGGASGGIDGLSAVPERFPA
jgi:hypothetical protein